MKRKKKKTIPRFKTEEQERRFWANHDSADYVDWRKAQYVTMANLKPTLKTISVRLPEIMIEQLKLLAHKKDVPYQSLMKIFLAERVEQELHR
jgi:predicted DNA binding CopG/RHH family protein